MAFPDPEGLRMGAHKVCNNAYRIKRFLLHIILLAYIPPNENGDYLKKIFELFSIYIYNRLCHSGKNFYG